VALLDLVSREFIFLVHYVAHHIYAESPKEFQSEDDLLPLAVTLAIMIVADERCPGIGMPMLLGEQLADMTVIALRKVAGLRLAGYDETGQRTDL
jgi:hypothetical protein